MPYRCCDLIRNMQKHFVGRRNVRTDFSLKWTCFVRNIQLRFRWAWKSFKLTHFHIEYCYSKLINIRTTQVNSVKKLKFENKRQKKTIFEKNESTNQRIKKIKKFIKTSKSIWSISFQILNFSSNIFFKQKK